MNSAKVGVLSDWAASLIVAVVAAILSISALCWSVREGVPQLSANSEFFAYSWVYALRWGAGENVFLPHSQLFIPLYAMINATFGMTTGGSDRIFAGWHAISFVWPLALMIASLVFIFATTDRRSPLPDVVFSSAVYLFSFTLFLNDHGINSLSYHSISIPLCLASLFCWRCYSSPSSEFSVRFYILLGVYGALCVLAKPTFLSFAAPFFAMEFVKAATNKSASRSAKFCFSVLVAIAFYCAWIFWFYGSVHGFKQHFQLSYQFMSSQANWYDAAKGANPFDWYVSYVIGKMGPLPTILIAAALTLPFTRPEWRVLQVGMVAGIGTSLFFLYNRSQVHAHPETMAVLATSAIAAFRYSSMQALLLRYPKIARSSAVPLGVSVAAVVIGLSFYPLTTKDGYATYMKSYDARIVHVVFQQPPDTRTIALGVYPYLMWGVTDAWCRGSGNIFDTERSVFLDRRFGNVTCMLNQENQKIDLKSYNRAVFVRDIEAPVTIERSFPNVAARFDRCKEVDTLPGNSKLVACDLVSSALGGKKTGEAAGGGSAAKPN